MKTEFNRRDFNKGAAAASLGLVSGLVDVTNVFGQASVSGAAHHGERAGSIYSVEPRKDRINPSNL